MLQGFISWCNFFPLKTYSKMLQTSTPLDSLKEVSGYFSSGSDGKEFACNAGDLGLIPGSGRSPGEGNESPLQYSCLENPMDRGAQRAIVPRVTIKWLTLSHSVVVCHAHLESFTHLYGLYIKVMHYFKKADDHTGFTFLKCSVD